MTLRTNSLLPGLKLELTLGVSFQSLIEIVWKITGLWLRKNNGVIFGKSGHGRKKETRRNDGMPAELRDMSTMAEIDDDRKARGGETGWEQVKT